MTTGRFSGSQRSGIPSDRQESSSEGVKTPVRRPLLRLLLLAPFCLLGYYGLMLWFHSSWTTGEPVLNVLTPAVKAASWFGGIWRSIFSRSQISSGLLAAFLVAALVGAARRRAVSTSILILALGVFGASQIALSAARIQLFYVLIGAASATLFVGLCFSRDVGVRRHTIPRPMAWLTVVILIAVVFRFYKLDSLPPGIHDEWAGYVMGAFKPFVDGGQNVIKAHFFNVRPLSQVGNISCMLSVLYLKVIGFTPLALALLTSTAGVLSVLALFFLVRRLFGSRVAVIACFLMAISPWYSFYSRTASAGASVSMTVLQSIVAYHILLLAFERRRSWIFAALGFIAGLSMYLYEPGKVTIGGLGLFGLFLLGRTLRRDRSWRNARILAAQLLCAGVCFALTLIPYLRWGLNDSAYLYSGQGPVVTQKLFWESQKEGAPSGLHLLKVNLQKLPATLTHDRSSPPYAFTGNNFGDSNRGVLGCAMTSFLAIGLVLAARKFRRESFLLLLAWIATALLPALITTVIPRRLTIIIPPLFICAGLGVDLILKVMADAWPYLARKRILAGFAGLLMIGLLCERLLEFQQIRYPAQLRASYIRHRRDLWETSKQGNVVTDLNNSIFRFVMADHAPPRVRPNLHDELLEHLGKSVEQKQGITFVLNSHESRNAQAVSALEKLGATTVDAKDFKIVSLDADVIEGIFGFDSSELPASEPGSRSISHIHRGALLVSASGSYRVMVRDAASIRIDGEKIAPTTSGTQVGYDKSLIKGVHSLEVITAGQTPPELMWKRLGPGGTQGTDPFVGRPHLNDIEELQPKQTRWTPAHWHLKRRTTLSYKDARYQPADFWVDSRGAIYLTEAAKSQVLIFDSDGQLISTVASGIRRPWMAVPDDDGGLFVSAGRGPVGLIRIDSNGEKLQAYPYVAHDLRRDSEGRLYFIRQREAFAMDPSTGKVLWRRKFPQPTLGLEITEDGVVVVVTVDGSVYRLNRRLEVASKTMIDPSVFKLRHPRRNQISVDGSGRIYVSSYWNNAVHIFSPKGATLLGVDASNNCPIRVKRPLDVLARGNEVHVLHPVKGGLYGVSTFEIQE